MRRLVRARAERVVAIGDVPETELHAGQLILLRHVVEQVPAEITAVVFAPWRRREAEERRFDSDHVAMPPKLVSSNAFAPLGESFGKFTPSVLVLK